MATTQKQTMQKSCPYAGIEPAAFELPPANVKNLTIDLLLKSLNKQVAGFK